MNLTEDGEHVKIKMNAANSFFLNKLENQDFDFIVENIEDLTFKVIVKYKNKRNILNIQAKDTGKN